MITHMTGVYRRRTDESEVHGREMADLLTAEIVAKYRVNDDTDFHIEFNYQDYIPDTGVQDPRGWALLNVESSFTDLAADLRDLADAVNEAIEDAHYAATNGPHRATVRRHVDNLRNYVNDIRADATAADSEAREEVENAQAWFYQMAAHAEADVPYDVEEGRIYEEAIANGLDGWDAVHAASKTL